jgi:hypothetical protein
MTPDEDLDFAQPDPAAPPQQAPDGDGDASSQPSSIDAGSSAPPSDGDAAGAPSEPTQADLDADKEPLAPDEAERLLRAGHRLRRKGDDPANWVTMSRHAGELVLATAASEELVRQTVNVGDLILADA